MHLHKLSLLVLAFLYVTIANVCLLKPVAGDEVLIGKVCAATQWPDSCQRCLSKPPGSDAPDEKALAGISVQCSLSLSHVVYSDFDEIAGDTGDNAVKTVCERCQESIWDAIKSLMGATVDCKNGQFDAASHHVVMAVESYSICSQVFQNITVPVPAPFMKDFTNLKEYYQNSQAILNQLAAI